MTISIYGDSIMRGTVLEPDGRYHSVMAKNIDAFERAFGIKVSNRARFGSTVTQGLALLERDLARGLTGEYALVAFGGNDCNFRWADVAAHPDCDHQPLTPIDRFEADYGALLTRLAQAGVTPIVMTLPPIDAERYLGHIGKTADRGRILQWLGDAQMIYRYHELYSAKVAALARQAGAWLADVRAQFLCDLSFSRLIGPDGIHLNAQGYGRLAGILEDFTARQSPAVQPGR